MTNGENVRVEFTYTFQDMEAGRKLFLKSQRRRSQRIISMILMSFLWGWVLLGLLIGLIVLLQRVPAIRNNGVLIVPIVAVIAIAAVALIRVGHRNWYKASCERRWREQNDPQPQIVTFSHEGIVWEDPIVRKEIKWWAFDHLAEDDEMILLLEKKTNCAGIPKRVMTSAQLVSLRTLLEIHIGSAKGFPVQ